MVLIEMYCVAMVALVGLAGILEGDVQMSRYTKARLSVKVLGTMGKRHKIREQNILNILISVGA